jgi:hypothetical protein
VTGGIKANNTVRWNNFISLSSNYTHYTRIDALFPFTHSRCQTNQPFLGDQIVFRVCLLQSIPPAIIAHSNLLPRSTKTRIPSQHIDCGLIIWIALSSKDAPNWKFCVPELSLVEPSVEPIRTIPNDTFVSPVHKDRTFLGVVS